MIKKRLFIIIFITILILSSCSIGNNSNLNHELADSPIAAQESTLAPIPTLEPTSVPTPSPTPEPKQPKYIFIVIGDGLGRGGMTLGEIYARIENADMSKGAVWENFPYQSYVQGMGQSASGGTAIACGVETKPYYIGRDIEGNKLYTIMDRAKQNGLATGVISDSSLTDATPATFMSHAYNRYGTTAIATDIHTGNIDYMAGGGMGAIVSQSDAKSFGKVDSMGYLPNYQAQDDILSNLLELGYDTFFGMEGALAMKESIASESFTSEKSIGSYTGGMQPLLYYKYRSTNISLYENIPSLKEMTEAGIQALSQNPNGFVMMIEEALIDKSGHRRNQEAYTYQVAELNDVLGRLMEFYNEHPHETLIILTADHETGNFLHNDELLDQWKTLPDFIWSDSGSDMAAFLNSQWGLRAYDANLQTQINKANAGKWSDINEDRAVLYGAVTLEVCNIYGTKLRTNDHSGQQVPLFVIGNGNDRFEGAAHIKEIPIIICELMGWEALPEILYEQ